MDFLLWANEEFLLHIADPIAKGKEDILCPSTVTTNPAESSLAQQKSPPCFASGMWSKGVFFMDTLFTSRLKDVER